MCFLYQISVSHQCGLAREYKTFWDIFVDIITIDFEDKYLSKRPTGAHENFYLQINQLWRETGIWYKKKHCGFNRVGNFMKDIGKSVKVDLPSGFLTNHSGRKTVAQTLQDADVHENAIMEIKVFKAFARVKKTTSCYHEYFMGWMGGRSTNKRNFIETSRSSILVCNSINAHEFSSDDIQRIFLFNNCQFSNVDFKI